MHGKSLEFGGRVEFDFQLDYLVTIDIGLFIHLQEDSVLEISMASK